MEEDIVRVLRILEYEGPRAWVEETLKRRGVKGERFVGSLSVIREAIIGEFSTVLKKKGGEQK